MDTSSALCVDNVEGGPTEDFQRFIVHVVSALLIPKLPCDMPVEFKHCSIQALLQCQVYTSTLCVGVTCLDVDKGLHNVILVQSFTLTTKTNVLCSICAGI